MPFDNDIDPTTPQDIESAAEGASRIRELKRGLIERLGTAFKGFPGENPDRPGEAKLFPIVSVQVGAEAERPSVPDREGMGWFSTDTGRLWVGDSEGQWRIVTSPFTDASGNVATITITDGWAGALGGSQNIPRVAMISVLDTPDSNGDIFVDLTGLAGGGGMGLVPGRMIIGNVVITGAGADFLLQGRFQGWDNINEILTIRIFRADGTPIWGPWATATDPVYFVLHLPFLVHIEDEYEYGPY